MTLSQEPERRVRVQVPFGSRLLGVMARHVKGAGVEVLGRNVWVISLL